MGSLVFYVLLFFGLMLLMCGGPHWSCQSRGEKMGFPSSYSVMEGCMLKVDDRWIPIEAYRVVP